MSTLLVTRWGARLGSRRMPCALGRGGMTRDKHEGDGATPAGLWRVTGLLYRPDRLPASAVPPWARPISPRDLWSDDPADPAYNHATRAPHAFSHERLRRADPLYDLVLTSDVNWPEAVPGKGSALFLHRWRKPRHPTAGCIAFAPADILWLAWAMPPGAKVFVRD
ncbi:L,D-transpeptidase family protein [Solirhodobacter olei]|uniref:L,D-transpeptidase family protein n=1 Tax=Solirhodobacter olei TaxID=2493082 RepID=UPI000FD8D2B6|nr:L,D-transpeptidase family protein [Solirhodobacter olei]